MSDDTNKPMDGDMPPQMDLFSLVDLKRGDRDEYSNTVDIYDAIPKYVWADRREVKELKTATITRECTIRGQRFVVKLKPALIEKRNGETVMIYPGQREELVEDVLRKLAVNGQGVYLKGKAGVSFTLYELINELARAGHTYSLDEVKESLMVCGGSMIECHSDGGDSVIKAPLFGMLGLTSKHDIQTKGREARCYVQFNPLVNEAILNLSFRQYNYQRGMDIRSPLARFIYKRMSQYWVQASEHHPYTPSLISFLEQSPRGADFPMRVNLQAMRRALDTLASHEVIERYEEEKLLEGKQKVRDATYTIFPHPKFVKDVIKANQRKKTITKQATTDGLFSE
ncbi:plasmid replication protein [Alcanivorax sp.]|uniref:plasmid replication protein n=1 Tax=Alcanivorax sp. TaxID=1872427 RepID=UPI0023520011